MLLFGVGLRSKKGQTFFLNFLTSEASGSLLLPLLKCGSVLNVPSTEHWKDFRTAASPSFSLSLLPRSMWLVRVDHPLHGYGSVNFSPFLMWLPPHPCQKNLTKHHHLRTSGGNVPFRLPLVSQTNKRALGAVHVSY